MPLLLFRFLSLNRSFKLGSPAAAAAAAAAAVAAGGSGGGGASAFPEPE